MALSRWLALRGSPISLTLWSDVLDDAYYTIATEARHEVKIKKSRFLAESFLVDSTTRTSEQLKEVRKREHAATHHCFAWIVGTDATTESKYSDDGEPNGTAGRPIYDAILGRALTNSLVVVTRYYGGTKLGTGGLSRAYAEAAQGVLESSGRRQHFLTRDICVEVGHNLYDQLARLIARLGVAQKDMEFSDNVRLTIVVRESLVDQVVDGITQLSAGKAKVEILDE